MPDWSRRHALQSAGGALLTALAGCNGSDSTNRSVPRDDRGRIDDITVLKVRNATPIPMVVRERDRNTEQPTTDVPPKRRGHIMEHVTAETDHGFVFPADVPGALDLKQVFEETDFESESIYLSQTTVSECYDRHLTGVYRESNGVDAQFCGTIRPADVACSTDEYDMTAFAIRLPFVGDNFNSVGGGHSSRCDGPHRRIIDPDTTRTVGDDGGSDQ